MVPSTRQEAVRNGATHYCTGKPCIHGHLSLRRTKDRICLACDVQQKTKKQKQLSVEERSAKYHSKREHYLMARKASVARNKERVIAENRYRKYAKKQRTPLWVDDDHKWMLQEAYTLARLRETLLGSKWHVDHIIPLKGRKVSGLHVIQNLQVIPAIMNLSKKNKFEVV